MTPDEVRERLQAIAEPEYRAGAQRYFKEGVRLYGVRTPAVKRIAAEVYRAGKNWTPQERNRFCAAMWRGGSLEEGVVAIYFYKRFAKTCHTCEFHLFEKWLDRWVGNWAHCDGVSSWLVAAALANAPALVRDVEEWTASPNRWKRRAAAVSLVPAAHRGEHTAAIFRIADRLRADGDDMVRKGVGWLLKETYPLKKRETVRLIRAGDPPFARAVLRIAVEKMSSADRLRVLG